MLLFIASWALLTLYFLLDDPDPLYDEAVFCLFSCFLLRQLSTDSHKHYSTETALNSPTISTSLCLVILCHISPYLTPFDMIHCFLLDRLSAFGFQGILRSQIYFPSHLLLPLSFLWWSFSLPELSPLARSKASSVHYSYPLHWWCHPTSWL